MQGAGAEGSGMCSIESSAPCRPPYGIFRWWCVRAGAGPRQGGADAGPLRLLGARPYGD